MKLTRLLALQSAINAGTTRQGFQMALGVVAAFAAAAATGLPERFWAVMTALIVMRSAAESTLAAGLDRAASTALGALCGVLGVWLIQRGGDAVAISLAIVALLAFMSGMAPAMRGAPIGALIVLSSAGVAEHAGVGVAVLRLAQVIVGVAAAMIVALLLAQWRSGDRLRLGCARLLRSAARRLADAGATAASSEPRSPSAGDASQSALKRLTVLAVDADRMASLLRRRDSGDQWKRLVGSTGRVMQDAAVLGRLVAAQARRDRSGSWRRSAQLAGAALLAAADAVESGRTANASEPQDGDLAETGSCALAASLAGPLRLLREDARALSRHAEKRSGLKSAC
ncbi:aromatic acid exporter family protein [Methylocapsa sp. S129]|uniref:FUSC family protein n=1 Tax=Methylocapsa sp. S129 TaxID=1641869 RepID=UPI00131B9DFA|nr:FUSC family protein [Methylocapsa sp. S129]